MADEQKERPRPHGDPLERDIVEDNRAQRQSDAPADVPALDEDDAEARRKRYDDGAEQVSKID